MRYPNLGPPVIADCVALLALREHPEWGGDWTVPDHDIQRMVEDLASDPCLFLDLELLPLGREHERSDSNRIQQHLNDWVPRLLDRGFDEAEVFAAWVDAARLRGSYFYAKLFTYSPWDRAYLYREGYLDRVLTAERAVLLLVTDTFRRDLAAIINEPVVEALVEAAHLALKRLWEGDEESRTYLYTAMRDMSSREAGEPGEYLSDRLGSCRPPGATLGITG